MHKNILRLIRIYIVIALLLLALLISSGSLFVYLNRDRDIDIALLKDIILSYTNNQYNNVGIDIDNLSMKFDSNDLAIYLHASNIKVSDDTNNFVLTLPQATITYRLQDFLAFHFNPYGLTLQHVDFFVNLDNKFVDTEPAAINADQMLLTIAGLVKNNSIFDQVLLEKSNAKIYVMDTIWDVLVPSIKITKTSYESSNVLQTDINLAIQPQTIKSNKNQKDVNIIPKFKPQIVHLTMYSSFEANHTSIHKIVLDKLDIFHLLPLLVNIDSKYDQYKKHLNNFAGDIDIKLENNKVDNFTAKIYSTKSGEINLGDLANNQTILYKDIQCSINHIGQDIDIDNLSVELQNGEKVALKGQIMNIADIDNAVFDFNLKVSNILADNIQNYWPANIAPRAQKWVISSIHDGIVTEGAGRVKFDMHDLQNRYIDPDSIDIDLHFKNASCNYHKNFPIINKISGIAHFSDSNINIKVLSAQLGQNSKLNDVEINVPYIFNENQQITIKGESTGSLEDLNLFIPYFKSDHYITHDALNTMSGDVSTQTHLVLPLKSPLNSSDIKYKVKLNVSNGSIKQIIPDFDVMGANMEGTFNGNFLALSGHVNITGHNQHQIHNGKVDFQIPIMSTGWTTKDAYLKISGNVDAPLARKILDRDFITGGSMHVATTFNFNQRKHIDFDSHFNLFNTELIWDDVGLKKRKKLPLSFSANGKYYPNNKIDIQKMTGLGTGYTLKGNAIYDLKHKQLNSLIINDAQYNKSDYALQYQNNNVKELYIYGNALDMSHINLFGSMKNQDQADTKYKINIQAKKIYMHNDIVFQHNNFNINCTEGHCDKISLDFSVGDQHKYSYRLSYNDNIGRFQAHGSNLGLLSQAFNIGTNKISKGVVQIQGTQELYGTDTIYEGDFEVFDYSIKNSDLFTKIMALSSLSGTKHILNDNIIFDAMSGKFRYSGAKNLTVKDVIMQGKQLGINLEHGNIDFKKNIIKFNGTFVPVVLGINRILSGVPLLGDILSGGKNGGIIATNFIIKGSIDKPKIIADPLSTLAPGFLKKIFSKGPQAKVQ